MKRFLISLIATLAMAGQVWAEAQTLDDQEVVDIEGLYKTPTPSTRKSEPSVESAPAESAIVETEIEAQPEVKVQTEQPAVKEEKVKRLTDLNRLAPFKEVSVIQKKYLPKTERVQLFVGAGMTTNSPWFLNLGAKVNVAYHFTESFGLEATGVFLSNSERDVAKEIRENNRLQPETFVNTKNYAGLDLFWAPIYGKVSFLNDRIVPFDMYFTLGGGSSSTNALEGNVPTFHFGTGQIFALSKSMAFRWDYSWTHFSATAIGTTSKSEYDDLILTAGLSFFFPEAKYR